MKNVELMKNFSNPVLDRSNRSTSFYPYYAGFSENFVRDAVEWVAPKHSRVGATILDPWNGAGTTTRVASELGIDSIGFDLNPVMVIVAKAELFDPSEVNSLRPLAKKITIYSSSLASKRSSPLSILLHDKSAAAVDSLADSIWQHLVDSDRPPGESFRWNQLSALASLMMVALFTSVRKNLVGFATSNPTWLKIPKIDSQRIHLTHEAINQSFLVEVDRLTHLIKSRPQRCLFEVTPVITVGDSRRIDLRAKKASGVVTSPPYCTRLDYGRATMVELLILQGLGVAEYSEARKKLIGVPVADKSRVLDINPAWGATCNKLLRDIYSHPSKASQTYYFNTHFSYFSDIYESLCALVSAVAPNGRMCIVVQDSFYKEVHNDLPAIFNEMLSGIGVVPCGQQTFGKTKSLSSINRGSRSYRGRKIPLESVLLFQKG